MVAPAVKEERWEEERRAKSKEMRRGNAKEKSWRREEKGTVGGIAHTIKKIVHTVTLVGNWRKCTKLFSACVLVQRLS